MLSSQKMIPTELADVNKLYIFHCLWCLYEWSFLIKVSVTIRCTALEPLLYPLTSTGRYTSPLCSYKAGPLNLDRQDSAGALEKPMACLQTHSGILTPRAMACSPRLTLHGQLNKTNGQILLDFRTRLNAPECPVLRPAFVWKQETDHLPAILVIAPGGSSQGGTCLVFVTTTALRLPNLSPHREVPV